MSIEQAAGIVSIQEQEWLPHEQSNTQSDKTQGHATSGGSARLTQTQHVNALGDVGDHAAEQKQHASYIDSFAANLAIVLY